MTEYRPYDYQQRGIDLGVASAEGRGPKRLLLSAPTGTGKSICEKELLRVCPGSLLMTTSSEIIDGLIEKGADESRIWTPIRLRNRLLDGSVKPPPVLIIDETHHSEAESWQHITMSCDAVEIGFTATPYRGTPKSTVDFRMYWGDPIWLITYPEALERGLITLPVCSTEPLVDDDLVTVTSNGEFDVQSIAAVTESKLMDFVKLVDSYPLDRPTMLTLTTRELCRMIAERLKTPCCIVDGDTSREDRREAFRACLACEKVLIQIAVVSEGVDLPIRRLIDAAPTMSPVKWTQLVGRAMRPCPTCGSRRCDCGVSQYICTNRNLLRHSYCLQGVMPIAKLVESQDAFGGLSKRDGLRVVGLEGLGRFKANAVALSNGLQGTMYQVECRDEATGGLRQYCCVVHPTGPDPLWATRINHAGAYGRWQRTDAPVGLVGFASGKGTAPSEKQRAWYERDAAKFGLDPAGEITRRTFAVLPVLSDLRVKLL